MSADRHVLVIGAGAIGLTTAIVAAEAGSAPDRGEGVMVSWGCATDAVDVLPRG